MRCIVLCSMLAACTPEDEQRYVVIQSPANGTMITGTAPIVFDLTTLNVSCCELFVDGRRWDPSSEVSTGANMVTWTPSTIANGSHEIRIVGTYDLVDYDDTVTLVFARP